MKKRILSLLLAVMMVATVFVMPASAEGETLPNDYSFKFEDVDARNQTADQVIDFGYKGESKVDIVVDGEIDEAYTTYGETREFGRVSGDTTNAPASVKVHFVVKDGYLYVAMESGLAAKTWLRVYTGVFSSEHSGSSMNRVYLEHNKSASGKLETLASANAYNDVVMNNSYKIQQVTTADYMKALEWNNGIYEMKIDIGALYKLSASWVQDFSWENPCLLFAFGFMKGGTGNPVTSAHTYYGIKPADCKDAADGKLTIGSTAVSDFIPYTIIIPEKTVKYVRANYAGVIGAVGTDWRNAIDGQLARVEDYATTAPNVNGTVASNEYTTTHSLPNGITANYAVHGGFLYAAFTYEEATHSAAYFEPFLMSNAGGNHILSRYSMKISTSGSVTVQDAAGSSRVQVAEPATLNSLIVETTSSEYFFTSKSASANRKPVTGAKSSHVDGVTTYELKVFIPTLIAMFEYAGWDATEGNCIQYNFMPGDSTENPSQYTLTTDQYTAVANHSGHRKTDTTGKSGVSTFVNPTVALPKGCTDYYRITDVYDLEPFGQRHVNAGPATAKVDGVVNPSEYTAMKEHKYNSTTPNGYYTGVDYYAQDDEYIYLATVVTHEVDGGTSAFTQFYITPYIDDGIVDVGQNADYNLQIRLNYASNYANGANLHTFGTNNKASRYPQTTLTDEKKAELRGNVEFFVTYKDNVATYEVAIKKSDLSYIFFGDENVEFDKFSVHIYYRGTFSGSNKDGQTKYAMNPSDPYVTLINLTNADDYNNSNRTNSFADVIHMTDYETKNGASVREADSYNRTGLRFKTLYSAEYIDEMKALAAKRGEELEIGTIIAPADYVEAVGEFTIEALEAKYGDKGYVDVKATVDSPFEEAGANGIVTYAGSLVNIKEANRDRDFAGIGYIKIGDEVWYSDFYCVRNASDVAKAATEDTKAESDGDKYVNAVTNLAGETVYTKYSVAKYNNFKALVVIK